MPLEVMRRLAGDRVSDTLRRRKRWWSSGRIYRHSGAVYAYFIPPPRTPPCAQLFLLVYFYIYRYILLIYIRILYTLSDSYFASALCIICMQNMLKIYMYIALYTCIYVLFSCCSPDVYLYIYMDMYICVYMYMYMFICITPIFVYVHVYI